MCFLPRLKSCQALIACLLIAFVAGPVFAQAEPDRVRITTVDGVNLLGTYYSGKGRAPTILMLHALGKDRKQAGWTNLAKTLQKEGYAVLTFDFRGHGESTEVDPQEFWNSAKYPYNQKRFIRGRVGRATVEYKDFTPSYLSVLVNDIAAAKAYLERKNDAGSCNTSSFVLIGAEDGAALGAVWMGSEWYRHRLKDGVFVGQKVPEMRPEGKDIICAIWLSMSPYLGKSRNALNIPVILSRAGKVEATPMLFLYGSEDTSGKKRARYYEKNLVDYQRNPANPSAKIRGPRFKYTAARPTPTVSWHKREAGKVP